jgi:hypothetical protein
MEEELVFQEEVRVSRQEVEGKKILQSIHEHKEESGGYFIEITGMPGSGKTSAMLSLANYTIQHHPNEKVYWSNSYGAPLQFFKIGEGMWKVLVQEGSGVKFYDRTTRKEVTNLDVTMFTDFNDLYYKAEGGKLNAVFFKDRTTWMDFIMFLRSIGGTWHHVYVDEMGEVCPSDSSGELYKKIGNFAIRVVGEIRKCNINLLYNTQSIADLDYRPRRKLQLKIFLPGAKVDGVTRIRQTAIDALKRDNVRGNYAYVDAMGVFGVIRFKDIYKPMNGFNLEARVEEEVKIDGISEDAS